MGQRRFGDTETLQTRSPRTSALNVVHRSFDLIAEHHKKNYNLATIPPKDQATYDMICKGDMVGVFQIESRVKCSLVYDLGNITT